MSTYLYLLLIVLIIFLIWLFYSMKLIIDYKGEDIFRLKLRIPLTITLMILLISYYIYWNDIILHNRMSIMQDYWWLIIIGFILCMLWPVVMLKNIYDLTVVIKKLEEGHKVEKKCSVVIALLLSIYLLPGIVYLQLHLNKIRAMLRN